MSRQQQVPISSIGMDPLEAAKILLSDDSVASRPAQGSAGSTPSSRSLSKAGPPKAEAQPRLTVPTKYDPNAEAPMRLPKLDKPPEPAAIFKGPAQPAVTIRPYKPPTSSAKPFPEKLAGGEKASEWMVMCAEPFAVQVNGIHTHLQPGQIVKALHYANGAATAKSFANQGVELEAVG